MEMNASTVIRRPAEVVFAYVLDLSNDANWRAGQPETTLDSGQVLGPGASGTTRVGDVEANWRVVSFVEGERVEWELISGPYLGRGGYKVEPVENATKFTLISDVEPAGFYRFLGPIFSWVGRRQNQADVERLRDLLDAP